VTVSRLAREGKAAPLRAVGGSATRRAWGTTVFFVFTKNVRAECLDVSSRSEADPKSHSAFDDANKQRLGSDDEPMNRR